LIETNVLPLSQLAVNIARDDGFRFVDRVVPRIIWEYPPMILKR